VGITSEYREEVEELESSLEKRLMPRGKASRAKKILDRLLPFALLSLAFVFLIGFGIPVGEKVALVIKYLNWALVLYFAARLVVGFRLAKSNRKFFRQHWLDFALVIPAFSLLKEVKALRLLEEFGVIKISEDTVAGSVFASRNAGVFTKITRIVRILKKSL